MPGNFGKNPSFWIGGLHLYLGLFISPFILLFAFSTLLFNHAWKPWDTSPQAEVRKTSAAVKIPANLEDLELAKRVMSQLNLSGEIINIFRNRNSLVIPVAKPGQVLTITVNLENHTAEIEKSRRDFWDILLYLHKSPGPHNTNIRGNWFYTRLWRILADGVVYSILVITAGGIYLWALSKASRKTGLILLGAGGISFFLILFCLV